VANKRPAKNAGKAPTVQFYFKDFMAKMAEHPPKIVGAWMLLLCKIWHERDGGSITKTLSQYALIMHTDEENAERYLNYFAAEDIATVTPHNGQITVVNRRTERDAKLLQQNRLRQKKYRGSIRNAENNADVTRQNPNPSSSTSSSTSSSSSNNIYTLQQVLDAAPLVGVDEEKATNFYHHYNGQGWLFGNGQPITNLNSALNKWKNNGYRFERQENTSGTGKLSPRPAKLWTDRSFTAPPEESSYRA